MGALQEELAQDLDGFEHVFGKISRVLGKYLENFGADLMT